MPYSATIAVLPARATLTLASVVNNDALTINGRGLTAKSSPSGVNEFLVGVSDTATAANLAACINANPTLAGLQVTATSSGVVVTITSVLSALTLASVNADYGTPAVITPSVNGNAPVTSVCVITNGDASLPHTISQVDRNTAAGDGPIRATVIGSTLQRNMNGVVLPANGTAAVSWQDNYPQAGPALTYPVDIEIYTDNGQVITPTVPLGSTKSVTVNPVVWSGAGQ